MKKVVIFLLAIKCAIKYLNLALYNTDLHKLTFRMPFYKQ